MKRKITLFTSVGLMVMIMTFMAQNAEILQLNFLFWSFTARRSYVLLIFLLAGALLSLLIQTILRWKKGRSTKVKSATPINDPDKSVDSTAENQNN